MANVPTAPVTITEEQFMALHTLWLAIPTHSPLDFARILCEVLDLPFEAVRDGMEFKLLGGVFDEDGEDECLIGWLHGIIPGVVLYSDPLLDNSLLAGLLQRQTDGVLYSVRHFDPCARVRIYDTRHVSAGFRICPAVMTGDYDRQQALPTVGFAPHRWNQELQPWLERWLPKT